MSNGIYKVKEAEVPEPIPVGMYAAKFERWEEKTDGNFGAYVLLEFGITEGNYKDTKRTLIASSKVTKGKTQETTSKLYHAVTGLLGREPNPDEEVKLDQLVGKDCMILVENRAGDKEGWQDITRVLPAQIAVSKES